MTKMTAAMPGVGNDQDTIYILGVTEGTNAWDSKISHNDLFWKVQYPDSAGGSDVVTFAYNALGQEIYKSDQSANVIQTDYDTGGRITSPRSGPPRSLRASTGPSNGSRWRT